MIQLNKTFFYLLPLLLFIACDSDDDSTPTTRELIQSQPWRVDSYDLKSSTPGITQELLDLFADAVVEEAPLNGTITFKESTFTIDDQGTTIDGTWTLSDDETEITMTFTVGAQTFTFQIQQITSGTFNLTYGATEDFNVVGSPISVTLEITAFLVPA